MYKFILFSLVTGDGERCLFLKHSTRMRLVATRVDNIIIVVTNIAVAAITKRPQSYSYSLLLIGVS